jgi:crotonobetainyl-CoA:carnitine CoA-transferase CaiB-like acyl-CoA transferase
MAETFLTSYGLGHLLQDERFGTNEARVQHAEALDAAVQSAIGSRTLAENLALIDKQKLTAIHVQTIADIERGPALAISRVDRGCAGRSGDGAHA